jgi:hypothetical protein
MEKENSTYGWHYLINQKESTKEKKKTSIKGSTNPNQTQTDTGKQ